VASNHVGLYLLAPCRIDRRLATRRLESIPRFGVRNVAIHSPVSSIVSIPDSDYCGIVWLYTPNLQRQVGSQRVPQARVLC